MLKLVEHSPQHTRYEERRTGLRVAALISLAVCAFALLAIGAQWRSAAAAFPDRAGDPRVILGVGVFVLLIALFAAGSVYVLLLSRQLTLVLDRERGDIILTAPRGLRMSREVVPYFGVKTVRLTGDADMRALALVFVLRDGRVIPITAAAAHQRDELEALAAHIRETLTA